MTMATSYISLAGVQDHTGYPVPEEMGHSLFDPNLGLVSLTDGFYPMNNAYTTSPPSLSSALSTPTTITANSSHQTSPILGRADAANLVLPNPLPAWDNLDELMTSAPESQPTTASNGKAQCWEHGCNGRQFSTWSNLKRHQKEKSGKTKKVLCPQCGGEFTRNTARDTHLAKGSCNRIRRYSNGRQRPSRVALMEMLLRSPHNENALEK
jgi:hypothetical protein